MVGVSVKADLRQRALEIGFDLVGVAPLGAWKDLEFSRQWVEKGFGGEMHYLENPKRHDPRSILPSAQSVVCVGLIYNSPLPYSTEVRSQKSEARREKPEEAKPIAGTEKAAPSRVSNFDFRVSQTAGGGPRTADNGLAGESPRAWISRYGWGRDYHEVMRAKLEKLRAAIEDSAPGVETRVYVDTGPIVERAFARLSGIGWTGKNTCLINEGKGSWFFLGVVLTSLELEPDLPAPDRCGSCTRCLEACPTGALVEPYVMDASRCIAYLNIELKGSIPLEFRPAIGANVFGCDICQDVCPWNSRSQKPEVRSQNVNDWPSGASHQPSAKGWGRASASTTSLPEFQPLEITLGSKSSGFAPRTTDDGQQTDNRISNFEFQSMQVPFEPRSADPESPVPSPESRTFSLFNPRLEDLAAMSEEDFRQAFCHSPIKRVKYRGWLRNLCVAMGNSGGARFVPKLKELAAHPDPVVREHAEWAMGRLEAGSRSSSQSSR